MRSASDAGRSHIDFARVGSGMGDEPGNCIGRHRWVHYQNIRKSSNARDRRNVADEIEIELSVERGVDRGWCADH